jgi:hypothetical protein
MRQLEKVGSGIVVKYEVRELKQQFLLLLKSIAYKLKI